MRLRLTFSWLFCALLLSAFRASAEPIDPARLAPESAVFYAELANLDPLLDAVLDPKTRELIQNADAYQRYRQSNEYQHMTAGVAMLEAKLGVRWQTAVRDLLGGGIAVCGDPASQSGFLALRCRQPELLKKLNAAVLEFSEADSKNKGRPSPVKSQEHRGITGWSFGPNECHIILDDLLIISNKADTLKAVIDRHLDAAAKGLTASSGFVQARAKKPAGALGWSWADLTVVRKDPNLAKALAAKSDNPAAEFLLGGFGDALRQAPYATTTLSLDNNRLRLRSELPFDASQRSASRQWYFAAGNEPALRPPATIGSFAFFRDLAGLWAARETLFNEAIVAKFAQADTQLGLFFSGRDFGPEVLGELAAPWQLVVARQEYRDDQPKPQLKLPAVALVLRLKHPEEFAPELLLTYQKIIGIANLDGGQKGRPQLLLSTEEYNGTTISKASYLPDSKISRDQAPVNYNFSPACARREEYFVLGSTTGIVRQLIDALADGPSSAPLTDNTALTLDAASLAAILADNRELLISQNMLSEGHTRDEAETSIGTVLAILHRLDRFAVRLKEEAAALALEATLDFRPTAP
ncbi:MAG TPA: hypothetical protein VJ783_02945 [Pirellulales bacterium]|nr:hypothetical protein [Pirellulales bacterium]